MQECPFDDYAGLVKFLLGNMRRKKDNFLVSEGPEGSGKSTTTGNLAIDLCQAQGRTFDVERDTIFTLDQLLEVLAIGEEGRVYDLDEAINIFHNQDWSTWEAKALSKIIRQMRIMRATWICNVPDFEGLHPYLRDYRTRIRLYHEPVWHDDGMGNGPSKMLWRQERFDYEEQRVVHRWQDVGDIEVPALDGVAAWSPYEARKRRNFSDLVADMRKRVREEDAKAQRREAKAAKATGGSAKRGRQAPPLTTT